MKTEGSADSLLELRLLGTCEVWVQGQPLPPLRYRKDLWLLALLTLRHGRAVARDELAVLFWPDAEESQALYYLRRSLSNLRRALGSEARRLLTPSPHTLRLDLSDADCDLLSFDAALARASVSATPEEPLQQAISLYRGPLLPECREEWALTERNVREQAYLSALERLARITQDKGEPSAAVRWLRLLLASDPYRESACCALMQALADCGDQAAVTQIYRDLRLLLRRDLNADPAPETDALYRNLLARETRPVVLRPASPPVGPPRRLPVPLSDLIGREKEIKEVVGWLGKCRLVTLLGTGGVGKTRLSIAVAERGIAQFPEGVWFVDLAPLNDAGLLTQTVLRRLDIREEPRCMPEESLEQALFPRTLLLVMDNCEHLLEGCASLIHRLLAACPNLRVLATSREALGLTGEHLYRVPSLSLPPTGQANMEKDASLLLGYEAVRLFVERARQSGSAFRLTRGNAERVVQICQRLDGIPLAIELAAARVRSLSLEEINARLDQRFRLLTGGSRAALPRQQTLRSLIDWSYDLLKEREKALLCRLSVFVGGWSLEAAEEVCAGEGRRKGEEEPTESPNTEDRNSLSPDDILDLLTSLCDKSLVAVDPTGSRVRYRLLETMRQYAQERLLEGEDGEMWRERHLAHFLALAEEAETQLTGPDQQTWLERLETEHDNLRAALEWSFQQRAAQGSRTEHQPPIPKVAALRLAAAIYLFWNIRGHLSEGREQLSRALAVPGEDPTARAKALNCAGALAQHQGDYAEAKSLLVESLALCRLLGEPQGISGSLGTLGSLAYFEGDYAEARRLFEEGLALNRQMDNPRAIAMSLGNLGGVAYLQGDYVVARTLYLESLGLFRELGNRRGIAISMERLGLLAQQQGDYPAAQALHGESLAIRRELGDRQGIAHSLDDLGELARCQGDYVEARALFEESLAISREIGNRKSIASVAYGLGTVASAQGDNAAARTLQGESLILTWELGDRLGIARSLERFAAMADTSGAQIHGPSLWGAAELMREEIGAPPTPNERAENDEQIAAARATLDDDAAFDAAWAAGRALTMDQAIAYALRQPKND
ncbi:MAG: hypothetical protein JWL77_114 [Chthonomonadaceae bacterium]|nr:hypothetical protein [Chthonomonadaceae bacterium]